MEVENLFSNVISFEENEEICNIPTEVEIKNVVFSMGSLKAPGPDGLPPSLLQALLGNSEKRSD